MGPKNLATSAHFILSLRPTSRRKKCPRTNKKCSNCQETLPRTILSSANRDHGRKMRHTTKGSLPERPKGKHKCNESAMRVWWRSNSRRNCHIRIKCPQLISWPHLCGHDSWTVLSGSPQLTEHQKEWLMGHALKYKHGWLTSVGPRWFKRNYIIQKTFRKKGTERVIREHRSDPNPPCTMFNQFR